MDDPGFDIERKSRIIILYTIFIIVFERNIWMH